MNGSSLFWFILRGVITKTLMKVRITFIQDMDLDLASCFLRICKICHFVKVSDLDLVIHDVDVCSTVSGLVMPYDDE